MTRASAAAARAKVQRVPAWAYRRLRDGAIAAVTFYRGSPWKGEEIVPCEVVLRARAAARKDGRGK